MRIGENKLKAKLLVDLSLFGIIYQMFAPFQTLMCREQDLSIRDPASWRHDKRELL